MSRILDRVLLVTTTIATISITGYMLVEGITRLTTGIAIVYVALAMFYIGYKYGIRKATAVKLG